jgi:transcriptional regulator with XRE-family HTH domain
LILGVTPTNAASAFAFSNRWQHHGSNGVCGRRKSVSQTWQYGHFVQNKKHMQSKPPLSTTQSAAQLQALGAPLRARRKALRVSSSVAAEATGMSRVTLHRIERGEPSVAAGAWANAMTALGMSREALNKASQAYGPAMARDLGKAIDRLQARQGWLERCMQTMAMTMPRAVLWQKVRALRSVLKTG